MYGEFVHEKLLYAIIFSDSLSLGKLSRNFLKWAIGSGIGVAVALAAAVILIAVHYRIKKVHKNYQCQQTDPPRR